MLDAISALREHEKHLDEQGEPLTPDDADHREACEAKIIEIYNKVGDALLPSLALLE